MKRTILALCAIVVLTFCAQAKDHKRSQHDETPVAVTIVDQPDAADVKHVYLSQQDPNDSGMTLETYNEDPKSFAKGWKDGWVWASKQTDIIAAMSADQTQDGTTVEKKLYGDIDNEPGQTKALGFFAAASILRARAQSQQAADAGPEPQPGGGNEVPGGWRVEAAVKKDLNDPSSYQFVQCWKPQASTFEGTPCWEVKIAFRAKNKFGGIMPATTYVYVVADPVNIVKILGTKPDITPDDQD